MATNESPLPFFADLSGNPLQNGLVYYGVAGQNPVTNPIPIYWDAAGTQPAAQPIKISNGVPMVNGSPGRPWLSASTYSRLVLDNQGRQVLSESQVSAPPSTADLSNTTDFTRGAALVGGVARVVDSIVSLRTMPKTGTPRAFVTGYSAAGDGVAVPYYLDPADTTSADNGATLIVANDGGRWKFPTNGRDSDKMFLAEGAYIHRIGDRLFVGDATKITGENVVNQSDWLTTYQLAKGRTGGSIHNAQTGFLNSHHNRAANTLVAGAQGTYLLGGYNAIGLTGIGLNNSTLSNVFSYGGYFEGYRDSVAVGGTYGIEIDTINFASVVETDPYQQLGGQTIGLQIAAGGEYPSAGQFAASAAINIRKNGSTFERGIIFGSDALSGATGTAGTAPAIVLGNGHQILWYSAAGVTTSSIVCQGATTGGGIAQVFIDGAINWNNSSGKTLFQLATQGTHVNYLSMRSAPTGSPTQVLALGDDANVDIQLLPKGTGAVFLGVYTAGAPAATGYITVKDSSGAVRKLLTA